MERQKFFYCDADCANTCPYDGARTELIEQLEKSTLEECLHCGDTYQFWYEVNHGTG